MPGPSGERCDECYYWSYDERCRRGAPVAYPNGVVRAAQREAMTEDGEHVEPYLIVWPDTAPDDWCGEFRPREK
jgi:hypothetical protein